jgi:hypothetical protein
MKTITTLYRPATSARGAKIAAHDGDRNRYAQAWDYELDTQANHDAAARALCIQMGWTERDLVRGATKDGYVYVFYTLDARLHFTAAEHEAAIETRRARGRRMAKQLFNAFEQK